MRRFERGAGSDKERDDNRDHPPAKGGSCGGRGSRRSSSFQSSGARTPSGLEVSALFHSIGLVHLALGLREWRRNPGVHQGLTELDQGSKLGGGGRLLGGEFPFPD